MSKESPPVLVVGVGASAGGLDALKRFFQTVPQNAPIAFIVVQHLDPNHESMMAGILERQTPFSFCQAKDNQTICAGKGYIIPPDAYNLIASQVFRLVAAPSGALGWATGVSIALALWSCRAGVAALIGGLNAIAGQRMRSGIWQVIVALLLTFALVTLAIVALTVVVIVPILLAFIPVANSTAWLLEGIRWLIALGVLMLGLSLLYRFGPARIGNRGRWFTVGAFVVVVLWVAASAGLSYYLTNFASYNEVYGSIGAVIGLLLWLYVSAYLILLGAALNVEVHGYDTPPDSEDTAFI